MANENTSIADLLKQAHACFEEGNYSGCLELSHQVLAQDPTIGEAAALAEEACRRQEDKALEAELNAHNEELKKQALQLLKAEEYEKCLGIYRFLCELEPPNQSLKVPLRICQEKLRERGVDPDQLLASSPLPAASESTEPVSIGSVQKEPPSPTAAAEPAAGQDLSLGGRSAILASLSAKRGLFLKIGAAISIGLAVFVLSRLLIMFLQDKPVNSSFATLAVYSAPEGASVQVNGILRGQTYLVIDPIMPGNCEVRVEKEGYKAIARNLSIKAGENANLSIVLEKEGGTSPQNLSPAQLQQQSQKLMDEGKLVESQQLLDLLLKRDPQNQYALQQQAALQSRLLDQTKAAIAARQWEEAQRSLATLLVIAPENVDAQQMQQQLNKQTAAASSSSRAEAKRLDSLHRDIQSAINRGNLFPPEPGNALVLLRQLQALAPEDPFAHVVSNQIAQAQANQINRAIQAGRREEARAKLRQALAYFPQNPQLQKIKSSLQPQEPSDMESEASLMAKGEAAMAAGRFVTPAGDNALEYCNRLLAAHPGNKGATAMKQQAFRRAWNQARELAQAGRFDEANQICKQLAALPRLEASFPAIAQELHREMAKLTFQSYPVLHEHTLLGNCQGQLRVNGYVISYVANADSKDGFTQKLSDILSVEGGDKLKIQFKGRTYRFAPNPTGTREENRQKVETILREINRQLGKS